MVGTTLSLSQQQQARNLFAYNDSQSSHLGKLSTQYIADTLQCHPTTIRRMRRCWVRTGEVERLRRPPGRPPKVSSILEEALVQLFLDNVDITIAEGLEWLREHFQVAICEETLRQILQRHCLSYKRLKYVAAQRCPLLRADYLLRVEDLYDDMLVFLDESAANEFTKDRRYGWSLKGSPAIKERDFRRSERWSILPAYCRDGYMASKIFQGSYTTQIFNSFVYNDVLPRMNAFPGPRSVLIMDNAKIHRSPLLQQLCNEQGVLLIYLPPYSPDFNPIEESFNQIKMWMRKNRDYLHYCRNFEEFFDWALEQFNVTGDPGSHFRQCGYTRQRPSD